MFQYVHTTSSVIKKGPAKNVLRPYVDHYLYSLINGLQQLNFGFDTINKVVYQIEAFNNNLDPHEKLFIDSGGYSIIVGDVAPKHINVFLECYHYFLENFAEKNCDKMFSLDIPVFLKYPQENTFDKILKYNRQSAHMSKSILQNNPKLYDKFIFVWQFKIQEQYDVWKQVYQEYYENDNNLKHFAIGGLVGVRGVTGIKFSPYIAPLYKLLKLVHDKNLDEESILHILGVYGIQDRFHLAFLQRMFNDEYLKDKNCSVKLSYDTINYFVSGLFKIRELTSIIPENGTYLYDYNHNLMDKMHRIVEYDDSLQSILTDINLLSSGKQLNDTVVYCYLNVVKNLIMDSIMDKVIDEHGIIEQFKSFDNFNSLKNSMNPLFKHLEIQYPFIFKNYIGKIMNNFQWIHSFHKWWEDGRDENRLEKGMEVFINNINFPKAITR